MDMSLKDPNWGKNISMKVKNPPIKGRKPSEKEFHKSLGLKNKPKERHNIEKIKERKRLPPPKWGQTFGHGNYSPTKMSMIDESQSKDFSKLEKNSSFISEEIFQKE